MNTRNIAVPGFSTMMTTMNIVSCDPTLVVPQNTLI